MKRKNIKAINKSYGARSRNRTGMMSPSRDFKSLVSTSSTIRAGRLLLVI